MRTSVLAYLIKPIKQIDLEVAVAVAMRRFREHRAVCDMAAALRVAGRAKTGRFFAKEQ